MLVWTKKDSSLELDKVKPILGMLQIPRGADGSASTPATVSAVIIATSAATAEAKVLQVVEVSMIAFFSHTASVVWHGTLSAGVTKIVVETGNAQPVADLIIFPPAGSTATVVEPEANRPAGMSLEMIGKALLAMGILLVWYGVFVPPLTASIEDLNDRIELHEDAMEQHRERVRLQALKLEQLVEEAKGNFYGGYGGNAPEREDQGSQTDRSEEDE